MATEHFSVLAFLLPLFRKVFLIYPVEIFTVRFIISQEWASSGVTVVEYANVSITTTAKHYIHGGFELRRSISSVLKENISCSLDCLFSPPSVSSVSDMMTTSAPSHGLNHQSQKLEKTVPSIICQPEVTIYVPNVPKCPVQVFCFVFPLEYVHAAVKVKESLGEVMKCCC